MEDQLSNDRIISSHRNKYDYQESPQDTLQFAYGDRRYDKMARDMEEVSNVLKLKILNEINEDFRRADFVTLAILSSHLIQNLIQHFKDHNDEIRELASRSLVDLY